MIAENSPGMKETSMKVGKSNNLGAGRLILWFLVALALAGCASRPINEPIAQVNPNSGYPPKTILF